MPEYDLGYDVDKAIKNGGGHGGARPGAGRKAGSKVVKERKLGIGLRAYRSDLDALTEMGYTAQSLLDEAIRRKLGKK